MTSKIEREIEKKKARWHEDLVKIKKMESQLYKPVPPKKPDEFKFDREEVSSFEFPVGIGNTMIEKKSDGNCVHVIINHKLSQDQKVRIYSSNSNPWNPSCFPEVVAELLKQPSGYYHGELLGLKPDHKEQFTALDEFIAVSKRPKLNSRDINPELIRQYPLKVDIFDILRYEKHPVLSKMLEGRRAMLEHIIQQGKHVSLIPQWKVKDSKSLQELFSQAIENNYEGLIAKDPLSLYLPGSRNSDWIKLKEFTTLDLAVLGLYETSESKSAGKPFSSVLVGTYNPEAKKFETIGKIKVGAKAEQDEIYARLPKMVSTMGDYAKAAKANLQIQINPVMKSIKRKIPDKIAYYSPKDNIVIAEIKILDITYSQNWHSCGLEHDGIKAHSLRLPTYKQLRKDKTRLEDVTTSQQVHGYYTG